MAVAASSLLNTSLLSGQVLSSSELNNACLYWVGPYRSWLNQETSLLELTTQQTQKQKFALISRD